MARDRSLGPSCDNIFFCVSDASAISCLIPGNGVPEVVKGASGSLVFPLFHISLMASAMPYIRCCASGWFHG